MKKSRYFYRIISMAGLVLLLSGNTLLAVQAPPAAIRNQLIIQSRFLYYPATVKRFYAATNYKLAWVAPDTVSTHASDAMLLLDCVRQYGLNHADYHPAQLLYNKLNTLTTHYALASANDKAAFDIFLTDAIIRFVNDLHYGKLNPRYTAKLLDSRINDGVAAETVLSLAIHSKNFMAAIENVQPKSAQYRELQRQMHLMAGVLVGDCYDLPEASLRNVAVNMERLRWFPIKGSRYVQINIPSFTLKVHQQDTDLSYRAIVGKKQTPTAVASGKLTAISIGEPVPDIRRWLPSLLNAPTYTEKHAYQIYDRDGRRMEPTAANIAAARQNPAKYRLIAPPTDPNLDNQINFKVDGANVILSGSASGRLLKNRQSALTNGSIRVDGADQLAMGLLAQYANQDSPAELRSAIKNKQLRQYRLKEPLPIYVTYLTCEVKDGLLQTYKDVYGRDQQVAEALYRGAHVVPAYQ
ncbi:hypothetical protein BDD43_2139 [Mucilaginibacter gracilis]|uniref:L,D-transpeptidase scaffold domain-containing protein n=1 Tax=Mucilaginibacter gracilis TaxID=423350 RepID=A0A495IZ77_9SPHI|nr:hypothetical protein [Mucilaginibacter gracilis]RKR81977.1 hypothetical protein BDD43_2139 [Mucilaginibacter gracilis]